MLDGANATNITLTLLNAVRDDQIPLADHPEGWKTEEHSLGTLGCLVSHVRTWHL